MAGQLAEVRREVQEAAETADAEIREPLLSVDEGLMEMTEGDKTEGGDTGNAPIHPDRLAEIEREIEDLELETDGETERHLEAALESIDDVRAQLESAEE